MLSGQDAMQGTRVFWRVIPGAKQDIQERVRGHAHCVWSTASKKNFCAALAQESCDMVPCKENLQPGMQIPSSTRPSL